ncbi:MAG: hypothetical protein BIFFINMI_01670 [Phycisphaerae bacterium]|nr:hypothetical protein [Phycisphaerae bacterium]
MQRLRRLLAITFIESFATIVVERGIYFFTENRLGFTASANLWLALAFGVTYVVGAVFSHRVSRRLGERRLLGLMLLGQTLAHAGLAVNAGPVAVFLLSGAIGGLNGMKWPLIESYVSAGRGPKQAAAAVGQFSIAWAASVPLALVATGPLIRWLPAGMFVLCAVVNIASLILVLPLPARPVHLPDGHPERPTPETLVTIGGLLRTSRWTLFAGYSSMWVLAALMPGIFSRLGYDVTVATALSGLLDLMRLVAFVVCIAWQGWHWRAWPLAGAIAALPAGFVGVLFGGQVGVVLAGEAVFGLAIGLVYYAALYYGMVAHNASVESSGTHEALIGMGFAAGPAAGLLGIALAVAGAVKGNIMGATVGVVPIFGCCAAASVRSLWRAAGGVRPGARASDPPGS